MKPSSLFVALALAVTARSALADDARLEGLGSVGIDYRFTSAIDLAREAGASGYGEGDDTTGRGALGFELRAGVLLPFELELDARGVLAVGGLDIDDVEQRYFGDTDEVGSTLSAGLDASVLYAPALDRGLRLLVGPAVGWRRLSVASGVGAAQVDLVGVGIDAGLRLELGALSDVVDGHLELVLHGRRELPTRVFVGQSRDRTLFTGTGHGDPVYSFGAGVSYVFAFHAS